MFRTRLHLVRKPEDDVKVECVDGMLTVARQGKKYSWTQLPPLDGVDAAKAKNISIAQLEALSDVRYIKKVATPEWALSVIQASPANIRRFRPKWIPELGRLIRTHLWGVGMPLIFSDVKSAEDAFHRLLAIWYANVPVTVHILIGAPKWLKLFCDDGVVRDSADAMDHSSVGLTEGVRKTFGSVLRGVEQGVGEGYNRVSNAHLQSLIPKHQEVWDLLVKHFSASLGERTYRRAAVLTALCRAYKYLPAQYKPELEAMAEAFSTGCCTGSRTLSAVSMWIFKVVRGWKSAGGGGGGGYRQNMYLWVANGIVAYLGEKMPLSSRRDSITAHLGFEITEDPFDPMRIEATVARIEKLKGR